MRREIIAIALMNLTDLTGSPTGHRRMVFRGNQTVQNRLKMLKHLVTREMIGDVEIPIPSTQGIGIH